MALVRDAWLQAGKACSSAHNPSPRFLPKLHSMPPSLRIRPEMCCPIRLSSTGCHGTRLNPSPPSPLKLSIIANRPLDSWVEPTSWPVTWLPGRFPQERGAAASCPHLVRAARFEHRGGSILVRREIPKLLTRPRRRMASGSLRSGQCPLGSITAEIGRPPDVRFPLDSDRIADLAGGPVSADSVEKVFFG